MLLNLQIKDLAIIDELAIDFSDGFNVVTGETGAGKSIIIKALGLLLGQKCTAQDLRVGCDKAIVAGTFKVSADHPARAYLNELGIIGAGDCGDEVLIRRVFQRRGRATSWLNDMPITQSALGHVGYLLVDICGQHDNQKILNPREHRKYLDSFLPRKNLLSRVSQTYDKCLKSHQEFCRFCRSYLKLLEEREFWEYRLEELERFNPSESEFATISEDAKRYESRFAESESLSHAVETLDRGLEGGALASGIWQAFECLSPCLDQGIIEVRQRLEVAAQEIDDISFLLNQRLSSTDADQERGHQAVARLTEYKDILQRFRLKSVKELMLHVDDIKGKISLIQKGPLEAAQLLEVFSQNVENLFALSRDLTRERRKAAKRIEKCIQLDLRELNMLGAKIEVGLEPHPTLFGESAEFLELLPAHISEEYGKVVDIFSTLRAQGAESVKFLFASGPGESFKPLEDVASGGEVSRIMLALKRALSAGAGTCVLVFDEIDTGISGMVADLVGRKLHELGRSFQVLCVSHLPQVAVYAETHFLVAKVKKGGRLKTLISSLNQDEHEKEIARLLSGSKVTEASIKNARAMIRKALQDAGVH